MGNHLKITGGSAQVFYAEFSSGSPVSPPDLDDVSGAVLTATDFTNANWTAMMHTVDGFAVEVNEEVHQYRVDELRGPVGGHLGDADGKVALASAEALTAESFKIALSSAKTATVAAGASQAAKTEIYHDLGDNSLRFYSLAFLETNEAGFSRVVIVPKVSPAGKMSTGYKKKEMRMVAAEFQLYEDPDASDSQDRFWQEHNYTAVPSS